MNNVPWCHGKHTTDDVCLDCREYNAVLHALEAVPRVAAAFERIADRLGK